MDVRGFEVLITVGMLVYLSSFTLVINNSACNHVHVHAVLSSDKGVFLVNVCH